MEWNELYGVDHQPSLEEIKEYIGGNVSEIWELLIQYMNSELKAKPAITYSTCKGKPGWNVKFQKTGISYGTYYPEKNSFSVFIVIGYKLDDKMKSLMVKLNKKISDLYRQADDYMKMGRWMMFSVNSREDFEALKLLLGVKKPEYQKRTTLQ